MTTTNDRWGEYEPIDLSNITRYTEPLLWRIVVTPLKPRRRIGNILIPETSDKAQEYLNTIGIVVAIGEQSYTGKFATSAAPKVGDFVNYGKHCGIHEKVVQPDGEEYTFVILSETDIAGKLSTLQGRKPSL